MPSRRPGGMMQRFSTIFLEDPIASPALTDKSDSGLHIDTFPCTTTVMQGDRDVIQAATTTHPTASKHQRIGARRQVRVPGRLTWRDSSGTLRFVSVMTSDVSDLDAFVECQVPASIPLYRLVHFQVERDARDCSALPPSLRGGKVLSAVYRVGKYRNQTGTPHGYALRLLVEPARKAAPARLAMAN